MTKQYKICFAVTEKQDARAKKLPRGFKLSERLREALDVILNAEKA